MRAVKNVKGVNINHNNCRGHDDIFYWVSYVGNIGRDFKKCSIKFIILIQLILFWAARLISLNSFIDVIFLSFALHYFKFARILACLYYYFFTVSMILLKDGFIAKVNKREQFIAWQDVVDVSQMGVFLRLTYALEGKKYKLKLLISQKNYGLLTLMLLLAYYNLELRDKVSKLLKVTQDMLMLKGKKQEADELRAIIENYSQLHKFIKENKFDEYPTLKEYLYCECLSKHAGFEEVPEYDIHNCVGERQNYLMSQKTLYTPLKEFLFSVYFFFLAAIAFIILAMLAGLLI